MKNLNTLVIGGTGFIGETLLKFLLDAGYGLAVLSRHSPPDSSRYSNIEYIQADVTLPGRWQELVADFDIVINLAGVSIFRRWTPRNKRLILESRILAAENILNALKVRRGKTKHIISVSGVGYYGFHGDEILDEGASPGSDFLATVASKWEETILPAGELGIRTVICRLGQVLGVHGGVFPRLATLARLHLASHWGSGEQWTSWIHEDDLAGCVLFLIENEAIAGPVNVTSPDPVRNREMMRLLAKLTGKRVIIPPVPYFALRLMTGEFATTFVNGQRVIPRKLINHGFSFVYPEPGKAFEALIRSQDRRKKKPS